MWIVMETSVIINYRLYCFEFYIVSFDLFLLFFLFYLDGDLFMDIFVKRVLPTCNAFPAARSVITMDNATTHIKARVEAECARVGV